MTLRAQLLVGVALTVVAMCGTWLWLDASGAFSREDDTGQTLRLVCPLH